jgi:hypothetical protein
LNDPTYVEAARVFAARILHEGGRPDSARLRWAFEQVLSRPPVDAEAGILSQLLEKHMRDYRNDRDSARKLVSVGEKPPARDLDPAEWAAWTSVARVLFNLHETITRN